MGGGGNMRTFITEEPIGLIPEIELILSQHKIPDKIQQNKPNFCDWHPLFVIDVHIRKNIDIRYSENVGAWR